MHMSNSCIYDRSTGNKMNTIKIFPFIHFTKILTKVTLTLNKLSFHRVFIILAPSFNKLFIPKFLTFHLNNN